MELSTDSGLVQLPNSTYHYLGYEVHLGLFSNANSHFTVDFGLTQPFSYNQYAQSIYFGAFGWEWTAGSSFVRPFFGLGLGLYADLISAPEGTASGFVPSLITQGGLKLGGEKFGLLLKASIYLGIYDVSQLFMATAWPLLNVMGGIYISL